MIDDLLQEAEARMQKTIKALEGQFRTLRTGRATPALLEGVSVIYYGTPTPIRQLAVISAPEPQMLLVRPYDPGSINEITRAILQADLGLNPSNDGRVIRVPIPRLTEERRKDLVKTVRKRMEEARIALRNIRRDALNDMREFEEEKLISEDELHRGQEKLQKLTDRYIEQVEALGKRKEQEIMEV